MNIVIKHSIGQKISRNFGFMMIRIALFAIRFLVKHDWRFSQKVSWKLAKIVEHFDSLDYDDRGYAANDLYLLDVSQGKLLDLSADDALTLTDSEMFEIWSQDCDYDFRKTQADC